MTDVLIQVPSDIAAPKFKMFQPVEIVGTSAKGVIVGMEYVSLFTAIADHDTSYGWEYRVDFKYGQPIEKALTCCDTVQSYDEDELAASDIEEIPAPGTKEVKGYVPATLDRFVRAIAGLRDASSSDVLKDAIEVWLKHPEQQKLIAEHNLEKLKQT